MGQWKWFGGGELIYPEEPEKIGQRIGFQSGWFICGVTGSGARSERDRLVINGLSRFGAGNSPVCCDPWEFPDVWCVCDVQIEEVWRSFGVFHHPSVFFNAGFNWKGVSYISAFRNAETPPDSEKKSRSANPPPLGSVYYEFRIHANLL